MLMTLAHAFMTATRMDGVAHAGTEPSAPRPGSAPRHGPGLAARALAALGRLVRQGRFGGS